MDDESLTYIILMFVALVFLFAGLCLFYVLIRSILMSNKSKSYKKILGEIIDCKTVHTFDNDIQDIEFQISYEYKVENIKYVSKQISFEYNIIERPRYDLKYPKGAEVDVYYNPLKPAQSVLELTDNVMLYYQLLIPLVIIILSLCVFFSCYSNFLELQN